MRAKRTVITLLTSLGLAALSQAAGAISWTMDYTTLSPLTSNCTGVVGSTATGCSITDTGSGIQATSTAFATQNQTTNITLQTAYVGVYTPGLGVTNLLLSQEGTRASPTVPYHTMDNAGQYEAILFHFSNPVTLSQVKIGYPSPGQTSCSGIPCGSDITVLAYSPGGASSPYAPSGTPGSLSGATFSNSAMTSHGWSVVGNYGNLTNNSDVANVSTSLLSTDWIIAAYDPSFGTCVNAKPGDTTSCSGNDFVKVLTLTGTTPTQHKAPEPDSLVLLAVAAIMGGWSASRKRAAR